MSPDADLIPVLGVRDIKINQFQKIGNPAESFRSRSLPQG
jgi:hypothetical protein